METQLVVSQSIRGIVLGVSFGEIMKLNLEKEFADEDTPTEEEVQEALDSLVAKGFIEKKILPDGSMGYMATEDGRVFLEHVDSDPATRN